MRWFVLLVLMMLFFVGAYMRAQQPSAWNSAMAALKAPASWRVNADSDSESMSLADLWSLWTGKAPPSNRPLPPLISDPAQLTTGPIHINTVVEENFLGQLNADEAAIDAQVNSMSGRGYVPSKEEWDSLDAKLAAVEAKVLSSPLTINDANLRHNMVLQRTNELALAGNAADYEKYQQIVEHLQADPVPELAALGQSPPPYTVPHCGWTVSAH